MVSPTPCTLCTSCRSGLRCGDWYAKHALENRVEVIQCHRGGGTSRHPIYELDSFLISNLGQLDYKPIGSQTGMYPLAH